MKILVVEPWNNIYMSWVHLIGIFEQNDILILIKIIENWVCIV